MEEMGCGFKWLFIDDDVRNTPSVRAGITLVEEQTFRMKQSTLIQTIGSKSRLTQLAMNTAVIFMHRFFMYRTIRQFPRLHLAIAFAFAGGKVEESFCKLEHLIRTAVEVIRSNKNREFLDKSDPLTYEMDCQWRSKMEALLHSNCSTDNQAYQDTRKIILECEAEIYAVIGFNLSIVHPHNYVIRMCGLLGAENIKDISHYAYNLATASSQLTMLCLKYKPEMIAVMCLYVAAKAHNVDFLSLQDKKWYQAFDTAIELSDVEAVSKEFLSVAKVHIPHWKDANGQQVFQRRSMSAAPRAHGTPSTTSTQVCRQPVQASSQASVPQPHHSGSSQAARPPTSSHHGPTGHRQPQPHHHHHHHHQHPNMPVSTAAPAGYPQSSSGHRQNPTDTVNSRNGAAVRGQVSRLHQHLSDSVPASSAQHQQAQQQRSQQQQQQHRQGVMVPTTSLPTSHSNFQSHSRSQNVPPHALHHPHLTTSASLPNLSAYNRDIPISQPVPSLHPHALNPSLAQITAVLDSHTSDSSITQVVPSIDKHSSHPDPSISQAAAHAEHHMRQRQWNRQDPAVSQNLPTNTRLGELRTDLSQQGVPKLVSDTELLQNPFVTESHAHLKQMPSGAESLAQFKQQTSVSDSFNQFKQQHLSTDSSAQLKQQPSYSHYKPQQAVTLGGSTQFKQQPTLTDSLGQFKQQPTLNESLGQHKQQPAGVGSSGQHKRQSIRGDSMAQMRQQQPKSDNTAHLRHQHPGVVEAQQTYHQQQQQISSRSQGRHIQQQASSQANMTRGQTKQAVELSPHTPPLPYPGSPVIQAMAAAQAQSVINVQTSQPSVAVGAHIAPGSGDAPHTPTQRHRNGQSLPSKSHAGNIGEVGYAQIRSKDVRKASPLDNSPHVGSGVVKQEAPDLGLVEEKTIPGDITSFPKPQDSPNNPRIKIKVKRESHSVKYADSGLKIKIKPPKPETEGGNEVVAPGLVPRSNTPKEEGEVESTPSPASSTGSHQKSEGLRIKLSVPKSSDRKRENGSGSSSGHRSHHHSHHRHHKSKKHSKHKSKRSASGDLLEERPAKSSRSDSHLSSASSSNLSLSLQTGGYPGLSSTSSFNSSSSESFHRGFSITDAMSTTMPNNIFDDDDDEDTLPSLPMTHVDTMSAPGHQHFQQSSAFLPPS